MQITGDVPAVITLWVRNCSTRLETDDLARAFPAFLRQANNDLHKYWPAHGGDGPDIPYVERIRELRDGPWPLDDSAWRATIFDHPQQAIADDDVADMPLESLRTLGYHYVHDGVPHIVVYAALAHDASLPWTLVFSHELLEALADPSTELLWPGTPEQYHVEICDPVQYLGYPLGGVWVSNFITPGWFFPPPDTLAADPDPPYDFACQLISPRQRSLGGERTLRINGRDRTETLTARGSVTTATVQGPQKQRRRRASPPAG
jgi:hypothetical protein